MKGLQTARVVVIDDDREEALLLLQAISRLGIGAVHFNGNIDQLPEAPLSGIRVVFLDVRLMTSPSTDPKQYVPQTLNVLAKAVQASRGVTGIVYWTKYDDDIQELEQRLPTAIPGFQPAFSLAIKDKSRFLKTNGETEPSSALEVEIQRVLEGLHACRLLWEWEQAVHDAASRTTNLLSDVAAAEEADDTRPLDDDLLKLLASLVVASAGKTITDVASCVAHLFDGLNPIHYDQIEQFARTGSVTGPHAERLRSRINEGVTLSPVQNARLNRVLLASVVADESISPQPGNVYVAAGWNVDADSPFPLLTDPESVKAFVDETWSHQKGNLLVTLADSAVPCLLEITPACDHAAGKMKEARLLGGVLIKSGGTKTSEEKRRLPDQSRMFARQTEFLLLENKSLGLDGSYTLVVNARHFYSKPLEELRLDKPVFRLRHQVVADIRAWFASHAARPGYISLR